MVAHLDQFFVNLFLDVGGDNLLIDSNLAKLVLDDRKPEAVIAGQ